MGVIVSACGPLAEFLLPVQSLVELVATQESGVLPGVQVRVTTGGYVPKEGFAVKETVGGDPLTITRQLAVWLAEVTVTVLVPVLP